ncbi:MAG: cupin domain-containing protein [Candidatus Thorarchaeota archaeon]|nr:MAG: cupin domain-containing protein [Candidatus Thorarchaeota archaeon]
MTSGNILDNPVFAKGPNKQPIVQREGYTVIRISLGKGGKIPPHIASHSAFFMVVKGKAIITSGDEQVELGENQYIAMEADQMRGIEALEDSVLLGVRD